MTPHPAGAAAASGPIGRAASWLVGTRGGRALLVVVALLEVGVWFLPIRALHPAWRGFDASVYVVAATALLEGRPLYDVSVDGYGFTYPPFAALVLVGLGVLGLGAGVSVATLLTPPTLWASLTATVRRLADVGWRTAAWWGLLLAVVTLPLYPVVTAFLMGQVDTWLMALVALDVLVFGRRTRGLGVGLAAAVKITPAAFVLVFLVQRDFRAAATATLSGLGATLLAWAITPADSARFWFVELWDTTRVGRQSVALNQSLAAVVARALDPAAQSLTGLPRWVWLLTVVVTVALGVWAMRRQARSSVTVLLVNALVILLIAPISWFHHWCWAALVLVALGWEAVRDPRRRPVLVGMMLVGLVALNVPPHWVFGNVNPWRPGGVWTWWEQILGASVVWWGIAAAWSLATRPPAGAER